MKYDMKKIMQTAHKIAKSLEMDVYKEALKLGLKEAWKIAKGEAIEVIREKKNVEISDRQLCWVHQLLGNVDRYEERVANVC